MIIEYHANNSGGKWWLKDRQWLALKKAGWVLMPKDHYFLYDENGSCQKNDDGIPKTTDDLELAQKLNKFAGMNFFKDEFHYAWLKCDSVKYALVSFEKATKMDVMDDGCNCCGAPHSFSWDGGYCSGDSCGVYLYGEKANFSKRELLKGNGE